MKKIQLLSNSYNVNFCMFGVSSVSLASKQYNFKAQDNCLNSEIKQIGFHDIAPGIFIYSLTKKELH